MADMRAVFVPGSGRSGPSAWPQQAGAPWRHPVDLRILERVPTLVVTRGWNALYEEVAAGLARAGVRHVLLTGHHHRPQDHPGADAEIVAHWSRPPAA